MSFAMDESPFEFNELFFSRTDLRGIILAGNLIFRRVSGYSWDELTNQPHNIIRHPDMPRAVFKVLWDTLEAGQPVAAYVKNRAKDHRHYWVFALALPMPNGYLSVRLKPSGPVFGVAQAEYAALRKVESKDQLKPERSKELLLARLGELGFPNYQKFMTHCLMNELECRRTKLGMPPLEILTQIQELSSVGGVILNDTAKMLEAYKTSIYLPLNLEIQSAHIEGGGASVMGVVASQYQKIVNEISQDTAAFQSMVDTVLANITTNQFVLCASLLLGEVSNAFSTEEDNAAETIHLKRLLTEYKGKCQESLAEVAAVLARFESICEKMRTLSTGLEIVRLIGKIESARLNSQLSVFEILMEQLKKFQVILDDTFDQISRSNTRMRAINTSLRSNPVFYQQT